LEWIILIFIATGRDEDFMLTRSILADCCETSGYTNLQRLLGLLQSSGNFLDLWQVVVAVCSHTPEHPSWGLERVSDGSRWKEMSTPAVLTFFLHYWRMSSWRTWCGKMDSPKRTLRMGIEWGQWSLAKSHEIHSRWRPKFELWRRGIEHEHDIKQGGTRQWPLWDVACKAQGEKEKESGGERVIESTVLGEVAQKKEAVGR